MPLLTARTPNTKDRMAGYAIGYMRARTGSWFTPWRALGYGLGLRSGDARRLGRRGGRGRARGNLFSTRE